MKPWIEFIPFPPSLKHNYFLDGNNNTIVCRRKHPRHSCHVRHALHTQGITRKRIPHNITWWNLFFRHRPILIYLNLLKEWWRGFVRIVIVPLWLSRVSTIPHSRVTVTTKNTDEIGGILGDPNPQRPQSDGCLVFYLNEAFFSLPAYRWVFYMNAER